MDTHGFETDLNNLSMLIGKCSDMEQCQNHAFVGKVMAMAVPGAHCSSWVSGVIPCFYVKFGAEGELDFKSQASSVTWALQLAQLCEGWGRRLESGL